MAETHARGGGGRRSLIAILAAMLVASALAVVAGGPAQAANTSGEVLIDTNGDGVPDSREFAGSHRYNTAVALADRFAADEGAVSTVIVASGESQIDAVTAAGLAGSLSAPVLLTRSGQLPHNVARFIDGHSVTDVVVVGGTAAVPDAIIAAIEGLGSRPSVERISGADRYATAAAIGDRLGGSIPTWCGSDQSAAILVNGGADGRADAVISGPLAYRLGLPILLTGADELPEPTSSFLTDNKVERVVVVGGMTSVSGDIVNELVEEVGVVNVQRISGGSAAATSVMVAKEMLGDCAAALQTNKDLVALANRDAIADGIAAAPVLGRGVGDGGPVPILLVGSALPSAISDYLSSTPQARAGNKTHLGIVAIGGTAVVSDTVMADAVAAAKTSTALTATITPLRYNTGDTIPAGKAVGDYTAEFRVTFSDDVKLAVDGPDSNTTVDEAERRGTVEDPKMYRLNGRRLEALIDTTAGNVESVGLRNLVFTADRTVTITLSHPLEAGDTVTVDNSANELAGMRLGAGNDRRKLEEALLTLPAVTVAADRTAPIVGFSADAGAGGFSIYVAEPNILHSEITGSNVGEFVSIQRGGRTLGVHSVIPRPAFRPATPGFTRYTVFAADAPGSSTPESLQAGDVVTVRRNAIIDEGGRGNALTRYTVPAVRNNIPVGTTSGGTAGTGFFEVESVSIGDYVHGTQAAANIVNSANTAAMTVTAKTTGVASGARGNDWTIYGLDNRAYANGNAFDIDVAVDTANQRISYTISDVQPQTPDPARSGGPTIGDLAAALVSNSDFNANFGVSYAAGSALDTKSAALGTPSPAGVDLTGGMSSVGVVLRTNGLAHGEPGRTAIAYAIAPNMDPGLTVSTSGPLKGVRAQPDRQLQLSYTADSMTKLPTRLGFRVIPAGAFVSRSNAPSIRKILHSLRFDASIKPF